MVLYILRLLQLIRTFYLEIFFINIIKDNSDSNKSTVGEVDGSNNRKET